MVWCSNVAPSCKFIEKFNYYLTEQSNAVITVKMCEILNSLCRLSKLHQEVVQQDYITF